MPVCTCQRFARSRYGAASWLLAWLLALGAPLARASGGPGWQRDPVLSPFLIQQLVTDAAGLRWAATDEGVYRYDGNEAVPLKSLVRRGPRLRVELVSALAFDRAGHLWIGGESGLLRFEPATGRLLAVPLPLGRDESPRVKALLYDPGTDRVWVGYGAGAVVLLAAARPPRVLFPVHRVANSECYFTAETGGHGAWLANDRGMLYHLAPDGTVRRQVRTPAQLLPVPGTRPQRFFGRRGLYVLDAAYRPHALCRWPRLLPELTNDPYVTDSTLDAVVAGQWLHVADVRGPRPRLTSTAVVTPAGEPDPRNCALARDPYGVWWRFDRSARGCYKQRQVRPVVEPVSRAGGAPAGSARLITRLPNGRLFVSTYDGVFTQAADSPAAPLRPWALRQPGRPGPYNNVFGAFFSDPTGRFAVLADELWGAVRLDFATGRISNLAHGPISSWRRATNGPGHAFALLHDRAGRLWMGGQTGLFQVTPDFTALRHFADERAGWPLHKLDITGLAEDPTNGALWITTNGGLFWLPPDHPDQLRAFTVGAPAGSRTRR